MDYLLIYIALGIAYTLLFVKIARRRGNLAQITASDAAHLFGVMAIWPIAGLGLLWIEFRDFVLFGGKND